LPAGLHRRSKQISYFLILTPFMAPLRHLIGSDIVDALNMATLYLTGHEPSGKPGWFIVRHWIDDGIFCQMRAADDPARDLFRAAVANPVKRTDIPDGCR